MGLQRRCSSLWSKMVVKSKAEQTITWVAPPKVPVKEEVGHEVDDVEVSRIGDKEKRPHRMGARMVDLPWPHIATPKSVQMGEVETDIGAEVWLPERDDQAVSEEQAIIQTEFTFEEELPDADYNSYYEFNPSFTRVERSINEKSHMGSQQWRQPLTDLVTLRTRERIPRNGVAYINFPLSFSCLHFAVGVTEAQSFDPRKWVGYESGSWGHYEDGRIGTRTDCHFGRVLKSDDEVGVLLYSPAEEKDAKLLFFRNEEPSGQVLTLPKNRDGWYFAVTMIGYHYGGVTARIAPRSPFAPRALEWLGSLLDPSDNDFLTGTTEAEYETKLIQNYCANRMNPYHVCNERCREVSPERDVTNDPYGKPYQSDDIALHPTWMKRSLASSNDGPHRHGSWTFHRQADGNRFYRTRSHDYFKGPNPKKKAGRTKMSNWNIGHMRHG